MHIIFDCGGSTGRWVLKSPDGQVDLCRTLPRGFNAQWANAAYFESFLNELLEDTEAWRPQIKSVRFYSAGIDDEQPPDFVKHALRRWFPHATSVVVASDLMGVAHAFLPDREGIVGIVGTGSIAGYFRDSQMIRWMRSLGYIYGDEGSGVHIARRVLQYLSAGLLPSEIEAAVYRFLGIEQSHHSALLEVLYHSPGPGQWMGRMVSSLPFLPGEKWWQPIVEECLMEYVRFKVLPLFSEYGPCPIVITGGIADVFRSTMERVFVQCGLPSPLIRRGFISLEKERESGDSFSHH